MKKLLLLFIPFLLQAQYTGYSGFLGWGDGSSADSTITLYITSSADNGVDSVDVTGTNDNTALTDSTYWLINREDVTVTWVNTDEIQKFDGWQPTATLGVGSATTVRIGLACLDTLGDTTAIAQRTHTMTDITPPAAGTLAASFQPGFQIALGWDYSEAGATVKLYSFEEDNPDSVLLGTYTSDTADTVVQPLTLKFAGNDELVLKKYTTDAAGNQSTAATVTLLPDYFTLWTDTGDVAVDSIDYAIIYRNISDSTVSGSDSTYIYYEDFILTSQAGDSLGFTLPDTNQIDTSYYATRLVVDGTRQDSLSNWVQWPEAGSGGGKNTYSDDFNRSDGELTSPWITAHLDTTMRVNNNQATSMAWATHAGMIYDSTVADDQWSQATMPASNGDYQGVLVRWDKTSANGYTAFITNDTNAYLAIVVNGSVSTLVYSTSLSGLYGSVLRLTASNDTLTVYQNGSQILQAINSTYSNGYIGIRSAQSGSGVDDWSGGDL